MVNDHSISFSSMVAWSFTAVSVVLFLAACMVKVAGADAAAFLLACTFIGSVAATTVAHVRTYVCYQNQLLRMIIAGQRGAGDGELRSV